jgi:hypothetical protein
MYKHQETSKKDHSFKQSPKDDLHSPGKSIEQSAPVQFKLPDFLRPFANSQETMQKQKTPNQTGIPDSVKEKFEESSGLSFDDVRVNYNSDRPAELGALAYTQGNQVHIAPGQEKHLEHELGHVVQQKQGRVQPTMSVGGAAVNDDAGLENEADSGVVQGKGAAPQDYSAAPIIQKKDDYIPNVGEPHLHIHNGGITFTSIGHRHKSLVVGDVVRQSAALEVLNMLKRNPHANNKEIEEYIERELHVKINDVVSDEQRIAEIKLMMIQMGISVDEFEYEVSDSDFVKNMSKYFPEGVGVRKEDEKPATGEGYIPEALLRNAAYIERLYEDYNNFIRKQ